MSEHYAKAMQLIALLSERWPQCFSVYGRRSRPLKVGIRDDIIAAGFDDDVSAALRHYAGNFEYRKRLKAGAPRIDLDGNVAGSVSAAEAEFAERILAKWERRKQAQQHIEAKMQAVEAREAPPKKLSLADLRAAAQARKKAVGEAAP